MRGATHIAGGLLVSLPLIIMGGEPNSIMPAAAFGALLPDLDHGGSSLGKKFPILCWLPHRGPLHSISVGIALAVVALFYRFPGVAGAVFLGYTSHLVLDALNPSGVSFFWPLCKQKISLAGIRTGSVAELTLLIMLSMLIVGFYLVRKVL